MPTLRGAREHTSALLPAQSGHAGDQRCPQTSRCPFGDPHRHPARDGCGSCRASAAHQYAAGVINGGHVIIYSGDAEADRAFFRDVLDYPHVDAGAGWLIFKLPPSEIAVHPVDGPPVHELYLMCDDLDATMAQLTAKGATFAAVTEARWGRLTKLRLPGGGELGLYEPRHPRATEL